MSIRELAKLNPVTGKVPVVRIDGESVFDSTLILRRFDELQPTPRLLSSDLVTAAKQRLLEDWSDESLYWNSQAIRWNVRNEARTIAQNSRFVPAILRPFAKPLLRRLVGTQPQKQGLGRLPYDLLISEFGKRLDDLVVLLGESPFFYSDEPSVADLAIYGVFHSGCSEGVTPDFSEQVEKRSELISWRDRLEKLIHS